MVQVSKQSDEPRRARSRQPVGVTPSIPCSIRTCSRPSATRRGSACWPAWPSAGGFARSARSPSAARSTCRSSRATSSSLSRRASSIPRSTDAVCCIGSALANCRRRCARSPTPSIPAARAESATRTPAATVKAPMAAAEHARPTLLFLCTGNSCRSQMAEG